VIRCLALLFVLALTAFGQQRFEQRGFLELDFTGYPQPALNDSGQEIGAGLLRYEASYQIAPGLQVKGAIDARTDTHRQVERSWRLDWNDRKLLRPAFSMRRLSLIYNRGNFTFEVGRQFIRWGKADILTPTDRFAPQDYLTVVDTNYLGVPAARLTYESGSNTVDAVWQARFVPSRTPLINQRWTVIPTELQYTPILDYGSRFPGGSAYGLRFNHVGRGYEASASFYDGWNNLPLLDVTPNASFSALQLQRYFPQLRSYGGDAAVPLKWLTIKAEAAYLTSNTPNAEDYWLYVIQLEKQKGEWSFVGGYAGDYVTQPSPTLQFAPDRGLAKTFLGQVSYTIDTNRSFLVKGAVRQNGDGIWLTAEYSQAFGQHWRATAGFTLIRGDITDFIGQYRLNSYGSLGLRYSF
jgi:hypothetical protein